MMPPRASPIPQSNDDLCPALYANTIRGFDTRRYFGKTSDREAADPFTLKKFQVPATAFCIAQILRYRLHQTVKSFEPW
jgi:hypothetical protein